MMREAVHDDLRVDAVEMWIVRGLFVKRCP